MGHPEALMHGMLLASGVLLIVPAIVAATAAAWYVRSRRQSEPFGGPGRGDGATRDPDRRL